MPVVSNMMFAYVEFQWRFQAGKTCLLLAWALQLLFLHQKLAATSICCHMLDSMQCHSKPFVLWHLQAYNRSVLNHGGG